MNLFEKMAAITAELGTVAKNLSVSAGKNQSYKAVGERDVCPALEQRAFLLALAAGASPDLRHDFSGREYDDSEVCGDIYRLNEIKGLHWLTPC